MSDIPTIYIYKEKETIALNGQTIDKVKLTVQGESLKECRKHFDELWSAK